MRKLCHLPLLLLACACSPEKPEQTPEAVIATGDVQAIKAERRAVQTHYDALRAQLDVLNSALAALDTSRYRIAVDVFQVKKTPFRHFLKVQGNVETKQNVVLSPEYNGVLNRLYVSEGQAVKKGQLLASISDGGLTQKLAQAKAQAALAETTFERQKRLWDQKIGSEIQYLQAKTQSESSREGVRQLQSQLAKTQMRAPFDGRIETLLSDPGQVVNAESKIIRLISLKKMYVEAEIPENYIRRITRGKPVNVTLPAIGKTYRGVIRQVSNYINPNNRSFSIQVDLPNPEGLVKPNLIAKLEITDYENPKAMVIPRNLIRKNARGQKWVYAIEKRQDTVGAVKRIPIATGLSSGGRAEVLKGLRPGQVLAASQVENLKSGDRVLIEQPK